MTRFLPSRSSAGSRDLRWGRRSVPGSCPAKAKPPSNLLLPMNTATPTKPTQPPLDQPLPADVIAGMTWGPFCYRRYPVFSFRWFKLRLLVSTIVVVLYGALSALGQRAGGESWASAWAAAGFFIMG